jgi:hypothetical protein
VGFDQRDRLLDQRLELLDCCNRLHPEQALQPCREVGRLDRHEPDRLVHATIV